LQLQESSEVSFDSQGYTVNPHSLMGTVLIFSIPALPPSSTSQALKLAGAPHVVA
jgi:hypothetical protein